ncbi:SET domain-containing protein-lysine N-methyltransferase [Iningainema sp. BLCCT55]|uniref:SET domain-containing protein-lysine N-methyltransferase n=2 Tax=Iningainema TaxID=1932705 RepID=A0A8J6XJH3_9CYAN|nr:SET domain-containing protein-lysine N-methyltransferase [Iningainema tapete BLCC-T55]
MFSDQKKLTTLQHKVTKVSSFAEVWECSKTGQKSLHANVNFIQDEVISTFQSKEILNEPNYLSVQLNDQQHIMLAPEFLQYINHSCNPNVFFDTTDLVLRCLRRIEVGEEMTFFYPSTEWCMAQTFDCDCKTHKCLGRIQGALYLHPAILQTYKLSDYIKQKLERIAR